MKPDDSLTIPMQYIYGDENMKPNNTLTIPLQKVYGDANISTFIYLFGVLCRFQHCTGYITTSSWKGRGNQYIQFIRVLYCKLLTNGKQLPAFQLEAMPGTEPQPQRWEVRVLPLCPSNISTNDSLSIPLQ